MTATLAPSTGSGRGAIGCAGRRVAPRPAGPATRPPAVRIHRRSAAVPAATYRRRRAIVGTILAVVTACGIVMAHDVLAGSGGVPASAAASQPARVRPTITAQPGDTLWSIASRYRGDIAITRYVDTLVDLNGGPSIQIGQAVVLP